VAWWDVVWRELQNFVDRLGGGVAEPDEIPEETDEEPGGFFGGEEPPGEPPGPADFGGEEPDHRGYDSADDGSYFGYHAGEGPYPEDWGPAEQQFWDTQFDGHIFDNQAQYDQAQPLFYDGYMATDDEISHVDRVQARDDFLDTTYFDAIDWDAFAEYYEARSG
jgi:hypothetical protein